MAKKKCIVKKVEKRFRCMLRYMRRKGVFDNRLRTWSDELSDKYRFVVWSEMWDDVSCFWDDDVVPFIIEILYTTCTTSHYHQIRNLFGMFICELDYFFKDVTKYQIYAALLGIAFEIDGDNGVFIREIDWSYYEKVKEVTRILKGKDWERYYEQIVEPIAKEFTIRNLSSNMFEKENGDGILEELQWDTDLDIEVIRFLAKDAWDYVDTCNSESYNPIWLFGTEHYKEIILRLRRAIEN